MKTLLLLVACLVALAWLTGPGWCPDSGFVDAPICHGSTDEEATR